MSSPNITQTEIKTANLRLKLLAAAPVPKALLVLGIPTMLGMLINALYNLIDTYFVGQLGTNQMGAVTVAFPLGQLVVGLGPLGKIMSMGTLIVFGFLKGFQPLAGREFALFPPFCCCQGFGA